MSLKKSPPLFSSTMLWSKKVEQLKAQGHNILSLSIGEPYWNTPTDIIEQAIQILSKDKLPYTSAQGLLDLRVEIVHHIKKQLNLEYSSEQVLVHPGSKFGLYLGLQNLNTHNISPHEVLIPLPAWSSYTQMVELGGGKPVFIPTSEAHQFKITAEDLEKHITTNTRAFIINSPHNPTGQVYSSKELKELSAVLKKNSHVLIISDDIYDHLCFTNSHKAPHILEVEPELRHQCLIINGLSKSYAMTGWRLGWSVGPKELIKSMTALQSQTTTCAPTLSQKVALLALNKEEEILKDLPLQLEPQRQYALKILNSITHLSFLPPDGAFYIWLNIQSYIQKGLFSSSEDFCEKLLHQHHVALVPGSSFSMEGYVRLCYSVDLTTLKMALSRLSDFVNQQILSPSKVG